MTKEKDKDRPREKILRYVESQAEAQLRFVVDLCEQNSYTYNKQGSDRVAETVIDHLENLLPSHQILKEDETGDHHILKNKPKSRAVYLVGHLDTVFPREHAFQRCSLEVNRLYGPGTADMKGGLAVLVYALKALDSVGLIDSMSIAMILNADEEIGSPTSQAIFEAERTNALACLVGECGGPNGEVVLSRNGKMGGRMDCFGEGRHVGEATHEKSSAILELAHKILELESFNAILPGVTVNVGRIEGGLGPSTVPEHASALVDVRWEDEHHREALRKEIEGRICATSKPGCRTEFHVLNARPAMPLHDGTRALYSMLRTAGERLGAQIPSEHRRGTSDANFFGVAGVPTLDGLGPVGAKDHTPDEYILVPSLKQRTALAALLMVDLVGKYF
jgi:glutamate carboxypeptidase